MYDNKATTLYQKQDILIRENYLKCFSVIQISIVHLFNDRVLKDFGCGI